MFHLTFVRTRELIHKNNLIFTIQTVPLFSFIFILGSYSSRLFSFDGTHQFMAYYVYTLQRVALTVDNIAECIMKRL